MTDIKALADECEWKARYISGLTPPLSETARLLRDASAALRRHVDLLDAIGDIDRGWTVREGGQILKRIAAVLEARDE